MGRGRFACFGGLEAVASAILGARLSLFNAVIAALIGLFWHCDRILTDTYMSLSLKVFRSEVALEQSGKLVSRDVSASAVTLTREGFPNMGSNCLVSSHRRPNTQSPCRLWRRSVTLRARQCRRQPETNAFKRIFDAHQIPPSVQSGNFISYRSFD